MIKNRLSEEMRIEYEVSFWTIRDVNKSDSDFLNAVDGKTPQEIIAKGKEIYQQRKEAGVPEYQKYKSWEEMITKFGRERIDQTKVKSDVRNNIPDPKTGNRDITYHL